MSRTYISIFNYGGGMRGLIPAHFMTRIEETTGLAMTDMVDIFTGPSTGAILNAALNVPHPHDITRPKYKARHMVRFYEREGIKIFPPDRFRDFRALIHDFNNRTMKIGKLKSLINHGHYDTKHLSFCLKALYGETKLSESVRSLVVPVYNLDGDHLEIAREKGEGDDAPVRTQNNFVDHGGYAVWLKNIKEGANLKKPPHVSLYDSVMASCAAPTYFPCHHFKSSGIEYTGIDGSIFDNPCISYHGAIRQHLPPGSKMNMIILGTGHTLRNFKKDDWNRFGGLGVVDPVNDLPLINILFHASESALVDSFEQEVGEGIYAFNKSLIADPDNPLLTNTRIDDGSSHNTKRMQHFFEEMMEENKNKFDTLCDVLVRNRDAKQSENVTAIKAAKKRFFLFGKRKSA